MKLRITKSFRDRLNDQVEYIANDKPGAARKFKNEIISRIKDIPKMPYANRKSIYFDRDDIRDMVIKGYLVVCKIDSEHQRIDVFGFTKYQGIHLINNYWLQHAGILHGSVW